MRKDRPVREHSGLGPKNAAFFNATRTSSADQGPAIEVLVSSKSKPEIR